MLLYSSCDADSVNTSLCQNYLWYAGKQNNYRSNTWKMGDNFINSFKYAFLRTPPRGVQQIGNHSDAVRLTAATMGRA